MCNPIALAAVAVVSTVTSVIGQVQSANAQAKAINAQNETRQGEIDRATTADINDRLREQRREQGRIITAAGESGLNLNSGAVETLLADSAMQASLAGQRSLANRESRKAATAADAQASMPSKPTVLGAGLQIVSSGASAYAGASNRKPK